MQLKPEQERVSSLLKETITLMCKNGLKFETKFTIDAVIGVTLDEKEVFLISVNEIFRTKKESAISDEDSSNVSDVEMGSISRRKKRKRNRLVKRELGSDGESGHEQDDDRPDAQSESLNRDSNDDNSIMFIKEEPHATSWPTSSCSFQDPNAGEQSELTFSPYPGADVSHDATDLKFADASFPSNVNQSMMNRSCPRQQASSAYLSPSGNHTVMSQIGGDHTQGANQSALDESCIGLPPGHYPRPIPSTPAREKPTKRCRICYMKGRRKEVRHYCVGCLAQPGLCLGECFRLFHTGPLPTRKTSTW